MNLLSSTHWTFNKIATILRMTFAFGKFNISILVGEPRGSPCTPSVIYVHYVFWIAKNILFQNLDVPPPQKKSGLKGIYGGHLGFYPPRPSNFVNVITFEPNVTET